MKNKNTEKQSSRLLLLLAVVFAVSFYVFKRPTQKNEFVKTVKTEAVAAVTIVSNSRAPASIPALETQEKSVAIALEKPDAAEVDFIPDGATRDYYKNNIHKQEFYDQVVQQLYKDYETNLEKNKDTVSFVLAQNVFLFDHSLGMDHPQRMDYLNATEKMLQSKEQLATELSNNEINRDNYRTQLHLLVNDYQARCSEIFDDHDYKTLFQLSKSDRFSENLGF